MAVKPEEIDLNHIHRKDVLQMEFHQIKDQTLIEVTWNCMN